ncbi:MAG: hypothetical protein ACRCT1_00780 [Microcoleaceae cyanobacterium]
MGNGEWGIGEVIGDWGIGDWGRFFLPSLLSSLSSLSSPSSPSSLSSLSSPSSSFFLLPSSFVANFRVCLNKPQ